MELPILDARYFEALAKLGTVRAFPKNTIVIQEGDASNQLYLVLSGRLKVFLADDEGKEMIMDVRGPNEFFGEMALDGAPRSANVMTMEPAKLAVIQHDQFKKFLADNPEAAYQLIISLIQRARNLTKMVGSLALLDVYGRVARLLLEHSSEENGRHVVAERMTQQEIAKRVGSSREMVSRILSDLKEGGYVAVESNRIEIRKTLPKKW